MLQQLKQEFCQLKVVDCGLWHEQVDRFENTKKPKLSAISHEVRYQRVKFCGKETRAHLGCAHTSLRCRAIQLVEEMASLMEEKAGDDKNLQQKICEFPLSYKQSLQKFEMDIIQHDIQKSELELAHAEVCEKLADGESPLLNDKLRAIEKKISVVVAQHKALNVEIRAFHQDMIATIEAIESKLN